MSRTTSRMVRWSWTTALLCAAGPLASAALAFVPLTPGLAPQNAERWNAVAGPDGNVVHINVAIEETAAEELTFAVTGDTAPEDVAAAQASIEAAFAAWSSPVLRFDVTLG